MQLMPTDRGMRVNLFPVGFVFFFFSFLRSHLSLSLTLAVRRTGLCCSLSLYTERLYMIRAIWQYFNPTALKFWFLGNDSIEVVAVCCTWLALSSANNARTAATSRRLCCISAWLLPPPSPIFFYRPPKKPRPFSRFHPPYVFARSLTENRIPSITCCGVYN